MQMSFFIKNKKRKTPTGRTSIPKPSKKSSKKLNEEIESDSDVDVGPESLDKKRGYDDFSSSSDEETAQEKKIRLAKEYIAQIRSEEEDKIDDDELKTDVIAHRLKQEYLEQSGKLHRQLACEYLQPEPTDIKVFRGHQLPVTCIVISPDEKYLFSASKDCSVIKWEIETGKKLKVLHGGRKGTEKTHIGHTSHILALAISSDGKFLASGDMNKLIKIWNPESLSFIHTFTGHRGALSGLVFRKGTHQLFSSSYDRSVKIWNLDEMSYVETLFGHQDTITAIDSLMRERAVTSGGRDGSIRVWKVIEESQLVFHGHTGSIDCVSLINESHFVSGADDNSVALWSVMKKKPLVTKNNAHNGQEGAENITAPDNWIITVASLQYTDLVASGSKDGFIRFWKCGPQFRSLEQIFTVPVKGFINCLKFSKDGTFLVAGVGQEHRLGRWERDKEAKNSVCIIKLRQKNNSL